MENKIRTRYAPSPTGYMHIGNLRTALYEYLTAKHSNGTFILRIEDTDQSRSMEDAVDIIYKTMRQTGLLWDEGPDIGGDFGPYIQSERKASYKNYAENLVKMGKAYYCFCSEERLKNLYATQTLSGEKVGNYDRHCRELSALNVEKLLSEGVPYVIRQKMPIDGITSFDDIVYGKIEVNNSVLEDQILIKSDEMPTYNFANVIDDHLMQITHVIRGNEYLSSTPKYNLLYEAFGWKIPQYIHCPPVMKDAQNKLSKRNGDASFGELIEKGYIGEAVLNYLLLLGWAPPQGEREIFSLEEMIKEWDPSRISKSPAIFDPVKLRHINAVYIRNMSSEHFKSIAIPWIQKVVHCEFNIDLLCKNLQPRCEVLSDLPERVSFIEKMLDYDIFLYQNDKAKTNIESSLEALLMLLPVLERIDIWQQDEIFEACKRCAINHGVKNVWLLFPMGIALSGLSASPGGGTDLAVILGKEKTILRINAAIEKIKTHI
jgi:glutamyl-tRNA synthetase